jgi:anti-anti-sigma regulatory factor
MEIRLDLGSPQTSLHVVVGGRLDVQNAAAFQQLMRHLQHFAGSGLTCDVSGADIADAAGRSAVESVRHHTEEFGGAVIDGVRPEDLAALVAGAAADVTPHPTD